MIKTVEDKIKEVQSVCSQVEEEIPHLWKTQKYILDKLKYPFSLLTEKTEEWQPYISFTSGSFRIKTKRRVGNSYLTYHLARIASESFSTCIVYPSLRFLHFNKRTFEGDDIFYSPNKIDWMTLDDYEKREKDNQFCIFDLESLNTKHPLINIESTNIIFTSDLE